jgi:hypothetical protein
VGEAQRAVVLGAEALRKLQQLGAAAGRCPVRVNVAMFG